MRQPTINFDLPIHILCHHPLVYRMLEKILAPSCRLVYPFSVAQIEGLAEYKCILIIDIHSVERWLEMALRYGVMKKQPVILLTDTPSTQEEEVRILHLGVRGVVPIANVENELAPAVEAVIAGQLWIRRNTLTEYIVQRHGLAGPASKLTSREQQIIACLLEGLSNKEIGQVLGISPRTVKFHVANVLQKFNVKNRRSLQAIKTSQSEPPVKEMTAYSISYSA